MRTLAGRNLPLLQRNLKDMPPDVQTDARQVLASKKSILDCFHRLLDLKITGMRARCHGDYHLGQVLYTGKDFVIIDFEGEPARPIGERRIKRSPLRDVAGMLRSFHYAAYAALIELEKRGIIRPDELPWLESWANYWSVWVSAAFLKSYLAIAAGANLIPAAGQEVKILLDALLLEKAVYELGYELNNRPGWVKIPIQGIRQLMTVDAD
jgi:maltose alpha-D-glucosyltransferase/alpha-amylase